MRIQVSRRVVESVFLLALLVVPSATVRAQIKFVSGQDVVPVFEGWEKDADGTYTMYFGYMNRNYKEEPYAPIGTNNFFEPGPADRGQPTHFYPRRQLFVFTVVVPADWGPPAKPSKHDLVWTVTINGKNEKAYGSLWPVWEIGDGTLSSNRGGGGTIGPGVVNHPPSIVVEGPREQTIGLSDTVTLSVSVTDDGIPRSRRRAADSDADLTRQGTGSTKPELEGPLTQNVVKPPPPGARPGVTWVLYRGEPNVTFSDMRPRLKDGKATITARFSAPGTYVLRAYADDGIRMTPADVAVEVVAK